MRNLAGVEPAIADAAVLDELATAGIVAIAAPSTRGEVRARYHGRLAFRDGRVVTFRRAWVYWTVECEPPIPASDARRINERPGDWGGTKYSGVSAQMGAAARAFGYAGGMDRAHLDSWCGDAGGVDSYHVDSPAALAGLVAALTEIYGSPTPPVADDKARELAELRAENRRLRTILDALARTEVGVGALVEVGVHGRGKRRAFVITVCRADRDEVAFGEDIRGALQAVARSLGGSMGHVAATRTGVTAGDPHQTGVGDAGRGGT